MQKNTNTKNISTTEIKAIGVSNGEGEGVILKKKKKKK